MHLTTSIRALTIAAALAISALGPAAGRAHAQDNADSGSAPKAQCETMRGHYNPKTLEKYKPGTKIEEGTVVGDTYDGKQYKCNKDGAWEMQIRRAPMSQLSRLPDATIAVAR